MKKSISSYSFAKLYGKDFTIFDAIKKTSELGFDGFEIAEAGIPEEVTEEFLKQIKDCCDSYGLVIPSYTVGGDMMKEDQDAEVERLCRQVDKAVILGAKVMRHDVAWGIPDWYKGARTFDSVLPILAKGVRAVCDYAETKGVKTCMENHGTFVQDSERVLKIVTAVGSKNYGVLADMGNFTCVDEQPEVSFGKVIGNAFHVHAKDMFLKSGMLPDPGKGWFRSRGGNYIRCTIIGHGDVPVLTCLNQLKTAKYDGYVSIEFEGIENVLESIEISAENLTRYMEM